MEVETEAKVDEPFEEYVKQVEVKPFDNVSAEVRKEMNADVIGMKKLLTLRRNLMIWTKRLMKLKEQS